jgi:hypothetical protein
MLIAMLIPILILMLMIMLIILLTTMTIPIDSPTFNDNSSPNFYTFGLILVLSSFTTLSATLTLVLT